VRQAEQNRILSVVFPAPPSAGPAESAQDSRVEIGRPLSERRSSPSGSRAWTIATFGAGGIAVGTASYLWISGLGDHSTLVSTCGKTHSCAPSAVDSAHRQLVIGDIVGAAGIGLVAVGIGLLVFTRPAVQPTLAVSLDPIPGGALLSLSAGL
jgi:hypothetical protein